MKKIFKVAMLLVASMAIGEVKAQTVITCQKSGTVGGVGTGRVYFDYSASTCVISTGIASITGAYDIQYSKYGQSNYAGFAADVNGNGVHSDEENLACTLGGQTYAAGVSCSTSSYVYPTSGSINYTEIGESRASNGDKVVMTVNVIATPGNNHEIVSATVKIGEATSSAAGGSLPSIQGAVSKSQTKVVATNIGTRFDTIGGEVGAIGRTNPTGGDVLEQAKQSLTSTGTDSWNTSVSHTRGVAREDAARELAMMASFDSSELMLGAAQKGTTDGVLAPQDREALLAERPVTVWGHGSYTNLDNDRLNGTEDSRYDGDVWGYNIGVDYRVSEKLYAGLSLGYSETDLTTTYNSGTYDETNWSLSPYAVYKPIEPLKLSFLAGYSMGDLDLSRNNGAITGDTDSDMWFAGLNADYTIQPNKQIPLDLTGSVGFLAAHKTVDAYQESDGTNVAKEVSNTRQAKAGVELAYTFDAKGTSIQPFTKVDFLYDFKDATNNDAFAFDIGGGLRLGNAATGLSGAIEGETQLGRDDYRQYSVSGMVAYGFSLGAKGDTNASQLQPFLKSDYETDAQSFGTGVKFVHGSGAFDAGLNLSHAVGDGAARDNSTAMLNMNMKF